MLATPKITDWLQVTPSPRTPASPEDKPSQNKRRRQRRMEKFQKTPLFPSSATSDHSILSSSTPAPNDHLVLSSSTPVTSTDSKQEDSSSKITSKSLDPVPGCSSKDSSFPTLPTAKKRRRTSFGLAAHSADKQQTACGIPRKEMMSASKK